MKRLHYLILIASFLLSSCAAPADVVATVVAALPTGAATEAVEPVSPEALAAGVAVYRQQYCGVCHTLDAAETRGLFGPSHNEAALAAEMHLSDSNYKGSAATVAEYLRESIVDPEAYIVDGYAATAHRMPPFGHLPTEDIDALVYLLLHQK